LHSCSLRFTIFLEKQGFTILQHHPDDFKKINEHLHGGHSADNGSTMMDKDRQKESLKSGIVEHTLPTTGNTDENFTGAILKLEVISLSESCHDVRVCFDISLEITIVIVTSSK
jgi:hypothetical protein